MSYKPYRQYLELEELQVLLRIPKHVLDSLLESRDADKSPIDFSNHSNSRTLSSLSAWLEAA